MDRLSVVLTVSAVVVACFGAGLVAERIVSPTVATVALTVALLISTVSGWMEKQ